MAGAPASTAVMASRQATTGESSLARKLNFFPTAPWATRSLIEDVLQPRRMLPRTSSPAVVWEPCCGAGHMAIPLSEYFASVFATDIHDWGFGERRDLDFLSASPTMAPPGLDWVIANPPFTLAERILQKALGIARVGVALLLRLQWLEGEERWRLIFNDRKPVLLAPFAERLPMIEGVWDPEASTATAYGWFVWLVDERPGFIRTEHIAPGAEARHTRIADLALATPGEAARRRAAKAAAEQDTPGMPGLFDMAATGGP